jgi:hypothetical protein
MNTYIVAATKEKAEARHGMEVMASSVTEAANKYEVFGGAIGGDPCFPSVWVLDEDAVEAEEVETDLTEKPQKNTEDGEEGA